MFSFHWKMYAAAVGFAVTQFAAFCVLVLYVSIANKSAGSPFVAVLGISGTSALLSAIFGVGIVLSITPLDPTTIFLATICFPACALLEVAVAYTLGDLLYYAGGAAEAKKPDFSKHSSGLGLWVVVPLWIVTSSGQLLILLTTEVNPVIFGLIATIVTLLIINFGYLRFADAEVHELTAWAHTLRFLKKSSASKPARGRQNDPILDGNMAAWVFIVTAFEGIHVLIAFMLSFLLPEVALSSIALAIASRLVLSIPVLLWAHFVAYSEDTRAFFSDVRGRMGLPPKNHSSSQPELESLTSVGKMAAVPLDAENRGFLDSSQT